MCLYFIISGFFSGENSGGSKLSWERNFCFQEKGCDALSVISGFQPCLAAVQNVRGNVDALILTTSVVHQRLK